MPAKHQEDERLLLAQVVRNACLVAARDAYRDAAISGLCSEGAQEAALGAIEMLDLAPLLLREEAC